MGQKEDTQHEVRTWYHRERKGVCQCLETSAFDSLGLRGMKAGMQIKDGEKRGVEQPLGSTTSVRDPVSIHVPRA